MDVPTGRGWRVPIMLAAAAAFALASVPGCTGERGIVAITIISVSPATGQTTGGNVVVITGNGFQTGVQVWIGGVPVRVVSVIGAHIQAETLPGTGTVDVSVGQNGVIEDTLVGAFTYVSDPRIASVDPASGPSSGSTPVTLTGSGFEAGATVWLGGVAAIPPVVLVSNRMITFRTPAAAGSGPVDVTVINPGGPPAMDTLIGGFTYIFDGPPTVVQMLPAAGQPAGGDFATVTGQGFQPGAGVAVGGVPAANVTVVSDTEITFLVPPGAVGPADVTVTNPDTQFGTLVGGYTYTTALGPFISALGTTSGPRSGGTTVVIGGVSFSTVGVQVFFDGLPAAIPGPVTATFITVLTPANQSGPADVTVINADGQLITLTDGFLYDPRLIFVLHTAGNNLNVLGLQEDSGTIVPLPAGPAAQLTPTDVAAVAIGAVQYAYVSGAAGQIHGWVAASDGTLTAVPGSPFTIGPGGLAQPASLTPASFGGRWFLYSVNRSDNTVAGFEINAADGSLTAVPGSPVATGGVAPNFAAYAPVAGGVPPAAPVFLMAANSASGSITAFSIAVDGSLTAALPAPFDSGASNPGALVFGQDRLFVAHTNFISVFDLAVDGGGNLSATQVSGSLFLTQGINGAGRSLSFVPGGAAGPDRILHASQSPPGLSVFQISLSGAFTPITAIGPVPGGLSTPIAAANAAGYGFVLDAGASQMGAFSLPTTGAPVPVAGSPFGTEGVTPGAMAVGQ